MRVGVATAGTFGIGGRSRATVAAREREAARQEVVAPVAGWSEEAFANQQIRGLVRQIFASGSSPEVRQVVFSAVDQETDVQEICFRAGRSLATETGEDVAIVVGEQRDAVESDRASSLHRNAVCIDRHLWRVSSPQCGKDEIGVEGLRQFMQQVRQEFAYSIVAGPAGSASECLAEFADGLVLVISALRTRRAAARKLLDDLSHVRLLGTVLQDREFPIPEEIYRRL